MKVHFSAPLRDIDKHFSSYDVIERAIRGSGHTLAKDWLQEYRDSRAQSRQFSKEEWEEVNSTTLTAIQEADAVIIEASTPSFSMGYISAQALAHKKPLLMLFELRPHSYILDSSNSLKRAEVYTSDKQLRDVVISFLQEVDVDANNLRFNLVLDREIYNFLNWESVNTGKAKAQIVREILKERIKRKD